MTNPSIASDLIERLRQEYTRIPGTGSRLINPDGPEAAEALSQLTREVEAYREALTASGETKAEYIGEFSFDLPVGFDRHGNDLHRSFDVPWTTIKEIMAAIRKRALSGSSGRVSDPKENNHD